MILVEVLPCKITQEKASKRLQAYRAIQTSGALVHPPLVVNHWESFCSERKHIRPSSAADFAHKYQIFNQLKIEAYVRLSGYCASVRVQETLH